MLPKVGILPYKDRLQETLKSTLYTHIPEWFSQAKVKPGEENSSDYEEG